MRNGKGFGIRRAATVLVLGAVAVPALTGTASAATISLSSAGKLAKAGVQVTGDLSGWTVQPGSLEKGAGSGSDATPFSCGGDRQVAYLAGDSAMANNDGTLILTGSAVTKSIGAAESDLAVSRSAKGTKCVAKSLGADALGSGGSMTVKRLSSEVSGADEGAVFRIVMKEAVGGQTYEVNGYLVEARVGRTELSVYSENASTKAPSLSQATKLMRRMASRVRHA
jgi:hypothetical protein